MEDTNLDLVSNITPTQGLTGITGHSISTNSNLPVRSSIDLSQSPLNVTDSLLNDSRITPTGNGNPNNKPYCTQPTSGQKWWAAVLLGFVFALISSPAAYYVTSKVTTSLGGITLMDGTGPIDPMGVPGFKPNFVGLLIHTLIFIIIIRIILW